MANERRLRSIGLPALLLAVFQGVGPTHCGPSFGSPADAHLGDEVLPPSLQARENVITSHNRALEALVAEPAAQGPVVTLDDADVVAAARDSAAKAGRSDLYFDYFRFRAAIDKVRRTGAGRLDIPAGTYHLYPPPGFPNNGGIIDMRELSHVVVDGHGALLLFSYVGRADAPLAGIHPRSGIHVTGGQGIVVRNLTMDWDETLAVPVTVSADGAGGTQQLHVDPRYPIDSGATLPIRAVFPFKVGTRTYYPSREMGPAESVVWRRWYNGGRRPYVCAPPAAGASAADCFRYTGRQTYALGPSQRFDPFPAEPGNFLATARDNAFAAILIDGVAADVGIENVTIWSSPGAGIVVINGGPGIRIAGNHIVRKPDALLRPGEAPRLISTLSDGIDINSAGGGVVIENNEVANQADDGLNIVASLRPAQVTGADSVTAKGGAVGTYFRAGGKVDIYAAKGNALLATDIAITSVAPAATPGFYALTLGGLAQPLPQGVPLLLRVHDFGSTNFIVRNNYFHDNMERGIVVHGQDGLVAGNRIERTAESGIQAVYDNVTGNPEGAAVSNLIIRDNVIRDVCLHWFAPEGRSVALPAAIAVYFGRRTDFRGNDFTPGNVLARHIAITGNTVQNVPGPGIFVSQAQDVTIAGNTLTATGRHPFGVPALDNRSIVVEESSDFHVEGNTADHESFVSMDH